MATHVEVVAADLKRIKLKVSPGTYLVDVLNEACEKLHLPSNKYLLKHKQKMVNLTGPFRTSGLPPGAKLELVVKSTNLSAVSIKLEVRTSESTLSVFTKKLPSNMTLWHVLRQFEAENPKLQATARGTPWRDLNHPIGFSTSGKMYYEMPVVNIFGREYASLKDLQKTLSQCGINAGNVLLRVEFRATKKPLHEALEEISQYMSSVEDNKPEDAPTQTKPASETAAQPAHLQTASTPTPNTQTEPIVPATEKTEPPPMVNGASEPSTATPTSNKNSSDDPLAPSAVFLPSQAAIIRAASIAEPDSAYEPTLAHMRTRQERLAASAVQKRLKSDAEVAADGAAEAERQASVKSATVRVRFPDGTAAQWTFGRSESGGWLYRAVRAVMRHPGKFKLVLPGPGGGLIEDDESKPLIASYSFLRGNVLLSFLWTESISVNAAKVSFLKEEVALSGKEIEVPEVPECEEVADQIKPAALQCKEKEKEEGSSRGVKMPKWFKLKK